MKWQHIIDDEDESEAKANSISDLANSDFILAETKLHEPFCKSN